MDTSAVHTAWLPATTYTIIILLSNLRGQSPQKIINEEDLSYNIIFQCWLWGFTPGFFINPLTLVLPKNMANFGYICVDGTNTLDPQDDGAPNQQIPKTGTPTWWDEIPYRLQHNIHLVPYLDVQYLSRLPGRGCLHDPGWHFLSFPSDILSSHDDASICISVCIPSMHPSWSIFEICSSSD